MKITTVIRTLAFAAPVLLVAGSAAAGDRHDRYAYFEVGYASYDNGSRCEPRSVNYCRADVDFDKLDAKLKCCRDGLELSVRYEVEIEDACGLGPLDLLLELQECGRPILDEEGKPVIYFVALDCPSDYDDDEVEFKGRFRTPIPRGLICLPCKSDVVAYVVTRADGRPIDRAVRDRIRVDD